MTKYVSAEKLVRVAILAAMDECRTVEDSLHVRALANDPARIATIIAKVMQVEAVAYRHLFTDDTGEVDYEYYDAPTGSDCAECESLYAAPVLPTYDEALERAEFEDWHAEKFGVDFVYDTRSKNEKENRFLVWQARAALREKD